MIRVVIDKAAKKDLSGTNATTGKAWAFSLQTAYGYCVDKETGEFGTFPDKFELQLEAGAPAYAKGEYTLSPASLYVDRNGRLAVKPVLVPVRAQAVKS